jgi:hypothetical protein
MRIDVCPNDKGNDVEKWHPRLLGKELLRKRQGYWRSNPANLHDREEARSNGSIDLVECPGTGNHSHRCQIDGVLNRRNLSQAYVLAANPCPKLPLEGCTDNQIADKYLQNLRSQACTS